MYLLRSLSVKKKKVTFLCVCLRMKPTIEHVYVCCCVMIKSKCSKLGLTKRYTVCKEQNMVAISMRCLFSVDLKMLSQLDS